MSGLNSFYLNWTMKSYFAFTVRDMSKSILIFFGDNILNISKHNRVPHNTFLPLLETGHRFCAEFARPED